jgi:hypothetical protein
MKCHVKWTCLPKRLLCRLGKILVTYIALLSRKLQYPGAAVRLAEADYMDSSNRQFNEVKETRIGNVKKEGGNYFKSNYGLCLEETGIFS